MADLPLNARMTPLALQAVVHDLKNALGSLEIELERLVVQQGLTQVTFAHVHCSQLRMRLLGFLLMTSDEGRLTARVEAHNPEDFLCEVRAGFVIPADGPRLDLSIAADCPPTAFFDDRLVNLALHALLANAARFARSRIVIGAAQGAGEGMDKNVAKSGLVLYCEDDGPGWGSGATPDGSGLGTSICDAVAAAHVSVRRRGRLVLTTSDLGGARAELHLP